MEELFAGRWLVPLRLRSAWRLLAVTAVGVLFAAALLAAGPLYADALSTLGLRFRLERQLGDDTLNTVTLDGLRPASGSDAVRRRDAVQAFDARVGWLGPETLEEARSSRLLLDFPPAAPGRDGGHAAHQPWNAFLYALSGFEQAVEVTAGRLPDPAGGAPEAVLPAGFQRHAALGDTVTLTVPEFDDCQAIPASLDPAVARNELRCRPSARVLQVVSATVVGFVRPRDPQQDRWRLFGGSFAVPDQPFLPHVDAALAMDASGGVNFDVVAALDGKGSMPLLTTPSQVAEAWAAAMPHLALRYRLGVVADPGKLRLGDVERGIDGVSQLREDLGTRLGLSPVVGFPIAETLAGFRNTRSFEQAPLLIILLQVVGLVVYYVAIVASMLVERQAEELSVLRSRGASGAQLVGLYVMEGTLIAAAAALVAPLLAARAVAALGYTPTFHVMTGGGPLPVVISPEAFLLAAGGAVLALLALLLPAFAVARRGIIDAKQAQARPPPRGILQRYYLDLGAVVLAALLLWQLDRRGSVFDPRSVGGWSSDPLLLAAPFVFTLAVAALVLRFYPLALRAVVRVLLLLGGTAVALGLRRAARAPAAYARLLLLLLMAVSVGTFAASYGSTVDRSQADRVRYATGVDLRGALSETNSAFYVDALARVRAVPGVDDAAVAYRAELVSPNLSRLQLLALDPARAESMLWFRDDLAQEPLPVLMRRLQSAVPTGGGLLLGAGTQQLEVSLLVTEARPQGKLKARFRNARGAYQETDIGSIQAGDWHRAVVPLPPPGGEPYSFAGFVVSEPRGASTPLPGAIYFDDLTAVYSGGRRVLLDDFERGRARFGWTMFSEGASKETWALVTSRALSGARSANWTWPVGSSPGWRLLAMNDPSLPLAVIVNAAGAAAVGAGVGEVGAIQLESTVVPVSVRAQVELFPTLSAGTPFVVVNIEHLAAAAALLGADRYSYPNELWASTHASLERQRAIVDTLRDPRGAVPVLVQPRHQAGELETVRSDPMLRASGSGILTVAFAAVLTVSVIGFAVTLVLGARGRTVEFAVLRAVGSSSLQVLRSMLLEWGVVLAIGVAIGVLLGRRVAGVMLSFLDVTESGAKVVPPFVLETNWLMLALGVGALTAAAAFALLAAWLSSVRRLAATELRLTR
ncbi:MAG: ABC transporter permease [Dehalococcoidia bacterium]|nr:ABC transporter permease [Dehalococcoidia bacterium]